MERDPPGDKLISSARVSRAVTHHPRGSRTNRRAKHSMTYLFLSFSERLRACAPVFVPAHNRYRAVVPVQYVSSWPFMWESLGRHGLGWSLPAQALRGVVD